MYNDMYLIQHNSTKKYYGGPFTFMIPEPTWTIVPLMAESYKSMDRAEKAIDKNRLEDCTIIKFTKTKIK